MRPSYDMNSLFTFNLGLVLTLEWLSNNENTRALCEICLKLTMKTPERCHSGAFIVNFEQILHIVLILPGYSQISAHWKISNRFKQDNNFVVTFYDSETQLLFK